MLKITIGSAKYLLGTEVSAISKEEPVANDGVVTEDSIIMNPPIELYET